MDGVVVRQPLAVTRPQVSELSPLEDGVRQPPQKRIHGHKKVARANRVKFRDIPECISPAEQFYCRDMDCHVLRYRMIISEDNVWIVTS